MRFGVVHHSLGHSVPVADAMRIASDSGALVFATGVRSAEPRQLAELALRYGLELVTHWGDRYIENGSAQPIGEFERFCRDICEPLGIRIVSTASTHHRWRKDPPLAEQLARLSAALSKLCRVAANYGITMAIENHADYRATDILAILDAVNSPHLGVQLDTGNPYAVAEEPVDAAQALAQHTVSTHIKDMTIRPLTAGEWVKVLGCALGDGDVDLLRIAGILATDARPDLPFMLEVEPPPGSDYQACFDQSVAYVKTHLMNLLTFASSTDGG